MAATDHPLKRLVSACITEFASWLLSAPVRAARPLNVELPATASAEGFRAACSASARHQLNGAPFLALRSASLSEFQEALEQA